MPPAELTDVAVMITVLTMLDLVFGALGSPTERWANARLESVSRRAARREPVSTREPQDWN
jgi:hypothetical protein